MTAGLDGFHDKCYQKNLYIVDTNQVVFVFF
jgi:hypothetical protein